MSKKSYEAIYPLSPPQQGMLFGTLVAPGSGIHIEQITCELRGTLDSSAFERAWQRVVERHAVLRTVFVWKNQEDPLQVVLDQVEVPFERQDWRQLSEAERQTKLDAYRKAARLRGFEVSKPPLMRLVISRKASGVAWSASSFSPFFDQNRPAILKASSGSAARSGAATRSISSRSPKRR